MRLMAGGSPANRLIHLHNLLSTPLPYDGDHRQGHGAAAKNASAAVTTAPFGISQGDRRDAADSADGSQENMGVIFRKEFILQIEPVTVCDISGRHRGDRGPGAPIGRSVMEILVRA